MFARRQSNESSTLQNNLYIIIKINLATRQLNGNGTISVQTFNSSLSLLSILFPANGTPYISWLHINYGHQRIALSNFALCSYFVPNGYI